jgi:hypothetical protein
MAAKRTSKRGKPAPAPAPALPVADVADVVARVEATGLVGRVYALPRGAIHGPGDYAAIAAALRDLAQPDLPLEKIVDAVDLGAREASLELSLDGVYAVLDATVSGSRVDEGVLVMLGALFDQRQRTTPTAARRGLFVDATTCKAAKTYLLICAPVESVAAASALAGTKFVPLTEI